MSDRERLEHQINRTRRASDRAFIAAYLAEYHQEHPVSLPVELREALGRPSAKEIRDLLVEVAQMAHSIADEEDSRSRNLEKMRANSQSRLKNNSAT